jgi:hypothetical protein
LDMIILHPLPSIQGLEVSQRLYRPYRASP